MCFKKRELTCAENDRHFGDSYQPITGLNKHEREELVKFSCAATLLA
jgi:hypothetical protein